MEKVKIQQLMDTSGVAFGTSGTRGLVADMTDDVCAAYVTAFLAVMLRSFQFKRIALGMDLRPSSPAIAAACAQAIHDAGLQVDFCGALPTPALALHALQQGIPAVMVTGSHIPFDRNGIKFYRPDGEISKTDELAIAASDVQLASQVTPDALPAIDTRAMTAYEQRYVDFFPAGILTGLRLGVYEHSSVARDPLRRILEKLGAEVVSLGRTDVFVPIDTEAVSAEDAARGRAWSAEYGFDALISTDGDGDRPLMSDEHGNWLRGDIVGLLCARYLEVKHLAVPVSCNTAIEQCGFFESVIRTRIGSPYVIAAMQNFEDNSSAIAGFEANGGFLLGSPIMHEGKALLPLPTRDAILPALAVLAAAREAGIAVSTLVKALPARYTASDRLQNIPTSTSKHLLDTWAAQPALFCEMMNQGYKISQVDLTDGLRMTLDSQDIIHLRPSGNAPELRCYCEAATPESAELMTQMVLARIAQEVSLIKD
ncbi:MAG: phosphomannomutase [Sulfuriferula sp.]